MIETLLVITDTQAVEWFFKGMAAFTGMVAVKLAIGFFKKGDGDFQHD